MLVESTLTDADTLPDVIRNNCNPVIALDGIPVKPDPSPSKLPEKDPDTPSVTTKLPVI